MRTEEKKPRNGDDSWSSDREKEDELMGVERDAAIPTTHEEMLRAVFGGVL